MKSNDFLKEDIVSDAQDMHLDHEVQMARQECYHAAEDAITLHKLLRHMSEQQGLEGWVSAKITLAADYLKTVREHLEYQLMSAASAAPEEQDTMQVVTVAENVITAEDLAPVDEGIGRDMAKLGGIAALGIGAGLGANYVDQQQPRVEVGGQKAYLIQHPGWGRVPDNAMTLQGKDGKTYTVWASRGKGSTQYYATPADNVKEGVAEAQSIGGALANALSRVEPGSKIDKKIKHHNDMVRRFGKGTMTSAPDGYHIDKKGLIRLGQGVAEGGPYDLPGIDYPRPGDTPTKPRYRGQQSPGVNPDDEAYFREIWRKKREAAKKAEQDKEQGISETSAGSVAGVVNPTPKNKAKVGSLFGGTYKQKKAAK